MGKKTINELHLDEVPSVAEGARILVLGSAEGGAPNGDISEVQQLDPGTTGQVLTQTANGFSMEDGAGLVDNNDGTYTGDGTISDVDTRADSNPYDSAGTNLTSANVGDALDELANTSETEVSDFSGSDTSTFDRNVGDQSYAYRGYNAPSFGSDPITEGEAFRIGSKLQVSGLDTELNANSELLSSRTIFVDPVVGSDIRTYSVGSSNFIASPYDEFRPFKSFDAAITAANPEDNLVAKGWDGSALEVAQFRQNIKVMGGDIASLTITNHPASFTSHVVDISGTTLTGDILVRGNSSGVNILVGQVDQTKRTETGRKDFIARFGQGSDKCNVTVLGDVTVDVETSGFGRGGCLFANGCNENRVTILGDVSVTSGLANIGDQSGLMVVDRADDNHVVLHGGYAQDPSILDGRPIRLVGANNCSLTLHSDFTSPYGISITGETSGNQVCGKLIRATSNNSDDINSIANSGHGVASAGNAGIQEYHFNIERLVSDNSFAFSVSGVQCRAMFYHPTHFQSGSPIAAIVGRTDLLGAPLPSPLPNENIELSGGTKIVAPASASAFGITNQELLTVSSNGEVWANVPEGILVNRVYGSTVTDTNVE